MNADKINAKIYAGRGKAASRLGESYVIYRPINTAYVQQVAVTQAAFNAGDNTYRKPHMPGDPFWHADTDGRFTQSADYLISQANGRVFFIAAMDSVLPILCVECNRTISISRPISNATGGAVGAVGYAGICNTPAEMSQVLSGLTLQGVGFFGASILFGRRGHKSLGLAAGVKEAGRRIMLPAIPQLSVMAGDLVTDDLGLKYVVEAAELSWTGWRIDANEVHT